MNRKPPLALIAGPTASGKSSLALALAQRTGGVIVNADSAQLYRDLAVLSASPDASEKALVEHRLYGIRDGAKPCSAAEWAEMARSEIADAQAATRLPILVGGTGLYLRCLLEGIAPVPPIDAKVRASVRSRPVEENWAELERLDPQASASLNRADSARIARALEVALSTGRTLGHWQGRREGGIGDRVELRPVILLPARQWLYDRCDLRFEAMLEAGAIEEVKALLDRKLDPSLPVMRAIGVAEIAAWLAGETSREEMIARGRQATRNYAKRQYTWFAHQPPKGWPRFTEPLGPSTIEQALALLDPKA
ncbi:MAG TPA: tRNA (adenosine(37)-N6)-dimethylallyltransferase MiaA [Sphingomicrobium sp.]|nr:tRNA (adenosine(37)-N6)-dimethylallyltransferase MiaA [Sphingomicrobium sp.]